MRFKVTVEDRHGIIAVHYVEAATPWQARDIEEAQGFKVLYVEQ
jgi:hypothetical protein